MKVLSLSAGVALIVVTALLIAFRNETGTVFNMVSFERDTLTKNTSASLIPMSFSNSSLFPNSTIETNILEQTANSPESEKDAEFTSGKSNATIDALLDAAVTEKATESKGMLELDSELETLGSSSNPLTIIIFLSGEMGNQLSKIAYGYSLKWILLEDYNVTTHVMLRHQESGKWSGAARNVQLCFPATRGWSFEDANTEEFLQRALQLQQLEQLQQQLQNGTKERRYDNFEFRSCPHEDCIRSKLSALVSILNTFNETGGGITSSTNGIPYNISLPFITADEFANVDYFNDRYASRISQELFYFDVDSPDCCALRADLDESVLHIRNFLVEMPRRGFRRGYEELSPNKVANELLGHLQAGEKVALTSRPLSGPSRAFSLSNYTEALEARGLQVRTIEDQNPTQDFCFLLSATKEFVGYSMSTYAIWAAYLGNATRSRLYSIKSPSRIAAFGEKAYFVTYNWTSARMRDKVVFEVYNSEEQDEVEKQNSVAIDTIG